MSEYKQQAIEAFYKDAFCANSAEVVYPFSPHDFIIEGVVKIETGDKRGIIYIASVKPLPEPPKD